MAPVATCFVVETIGAVRRPERRQRLLAGRYLNLPLAVYALKSDLFARAPANPAIVQSALTLLIVMPMGPFVYRLAFAYEPIDEATMLLLIVAVKRKRLRVIASLLFLFLFHVAARGIARETVLPPLPPSSRCPYCRDQSKCPSINLRRSIAWRVTRSSPSVSCR